jgi:tetratricopeptide (TPR) repeat protein
MSKAKGKMATPPADVASQSLTSYVQSGSIADLKEAVRWTERALDATPPDTSDYPALSANLGALWVALFSHSHDPENLEKAINVLRQALEVMPRGTPGYAASLFYLATSLSELGRRDEAVAANREAVAIRRRLAETDPGAYLPDLAMNLNNLAADLAELGQPDEAVAASSEAVAIRRRLAETNPDAYAPDLAMNLNNLAVALSGAGHAEEAKAAAEEAVQLYRLLTAADPTYEPGLARGLSILGNRLADYGHAEDAQAAAEEAVQLYRELAATNPLAFEPELAMARSNLRVFLGDEPQKTPAAQAPAQEPSMVIDDPVRDRVAAELAALDPGGVRMGAAIRGALDMLLDGQHTGRYRWEQLHKTEKTHAGTLVAVGLARSLQLADGVALDYTIAGADVDCVFSRRLGGWMIPPEADGQLLLLVQASDEDSTWSAGLLRATPENLSRAGNRDGKRALNDRGRAAIYWLHHRAPLQENALLKLSEQDVAAIFAAGSGQQRVNELFRRAQRMRVSRTVVATVAMQDDYMKRVRDGGGARDQLRAEGIVIFGDYAGDQMLASALGLPRPGPGEFVSARLARRVGWHDVYARSIRLDGADWLLASPADPAGRAPAVPR